MPFCKGIKKDGSRCKRELERGDKFCWQHKPGRSQKRSKSPLKNTVNKHYSRKLTKLSGVKTFSFFNDINGRRILLLGEAHMRMGFCEDLDKIRGEYEVENWLYKLVKNAPECLDIIVEEKPLSESYSNLPKEIVVKDQKIKLSGINNIDNIFRDCSPFSGKQCFSDGIRYHYGEIRKYNDLELGIVSMLKEYINKRQKNNPNTNPITLLLGTSPIKFNRQFWDKRGEILEYLLGISDDDSVYKSYMKYISKSLDVNYYENKDDLFMSEIRKKINKELDKMSIDKERFLNTLLQVYMNFNKEIISDIYTIITSCIMDLYILPRMFIQFDKKKMGRSPSRCRENEQMKNIIFYGGALHSLIYREFIKLYFEKEPIISVGELNLSEKDKTKMLNGHCISLNKPFDFFGTFKSLRGKSRRDKAFKRSRRKSPFSGSE